MREAQEGRQALRPAVPCLTWRIGRPGILVGHELFTIKKSRSFECICLRKQPLCPRPRRFRPRREPKASDLLIRALMMFWFVQDALLYPSGLPLFSFHLSGPLGAFSCMILFVKDFPGRVGNSCPLNTFFSRLSHRFCPYYLSCSLPSVLS